MCNKVIWMYRCDMVLCELHSYFHVNWCQKHRTLSCQVSIIHWHVLLSWSRRWIYAFISWIWGTSGDKKDYSLPSLQSFTRTSIAWPGTIPYNAMHVIVRDTLDCDARCACAHHVYLLSLCQTRTQQQQRASATPLPSFASGKQGRARGQHA